MLKRERERERKETQQTKTLFCHLRYASEERERERERGWNFNKLGERRDAANEETHQNTPKAAKRRQVFWCLDVLSCSTRTKRRSRRITEKTHSNVAPLEKTHGQHPQ